MDYLHKEKTMSKELKHRIIYLVLALAIMAFAWNRSIKLSAGESIVIHGNCSQLIAEPLGGHWKKGEIHSDWLVSCEWGED